MSQTQIEHAPSAWNTSVAWIHFLKKTIYGLVQVISALLIPVAVLGLWYLATAYQWLPEQILPSPQLVALTTVELWQSGELSFHFQISAVRIFWSVLIGGTVGLSLGVWLGLMQRSRDYVFPSVQLIAQFPIVGWIPLLMIFLGIDEALKIAAISLAVFAPVLIATYRSILNVPRHLLEVAEVYQFSAWQKFQRVIIPAAFPSVIGGLRQGVMQAWLALVFVELLASSEGIGFLMVWGRQLMQLDLVFMGIILIGLTGYVLDSILAKAEQYSRYLQSRRKE